MTSWLLALVIALIINGRKLLNSYYDEMIIINTIKNQTNET